MPSLRDYFRRWLRRPKLRPWALVTPVIVLLICLPLLRPARHPGDPAPEETVRIGTVRALVETRSLKLDPVEVSREFLSLEHPRDVRDPPIIRVGTDYYANQPPVMAVMLAAPYWVMTQFGLTFENNATLVTYLLTLIGATLPVAVCGALVYRMGRLFELRRMWRTALSLVVVLGSGLISYAVALNPNAPAAVLILAAAGCLLQVATSKKPGRSGGWLALGGFAAALAGVLDPAALVLAVLFIPVIAAIRMRPSLRSGGVLLYLLGAAPPLALHAAMNIPITGDLRPGSFHPELAVKRPELTPPPTAGLDVPAEEDEPVRRSVWLQIGRFINRALIGLIGSHGIFSHFPVLIVGIGGVLAVMHRNWLPWTKTLAAATLIGGSAILATYAASSLDWRNAMFASRWFLVFLPLVLFWAGAWARRHHSKTTWGLAGAALAFSIVVALLGATNPLPRDGFDRYTAAAALKQLIHRDDSAGTRDGVLVTRE